MRVEKVDPGPLYVLKSGYYSPALVTAAKAVPGMSYDGAMRGWLGYPDAIAAVVARLRKEGLRLDDSALPEPEGWKTARSPFLFAANNLRPYQVEGVRFLIAKSAEGALLADGMRLGKSAQATTAARAFKQRTLVVCPSHVVGVWARPPETPVEAGGPGEIARWWPEAWKPDPPNENAPAVDFDTRGVCVLEGVKPAKAQDAMRKLLAKTKRTPDEERTLAAARAELALHAGRLSRAKVIVCHFEIIYAWVEVLRLWSVATFIFDECHAGSSWKSRRSEAFREICLMSRRRIFLSGTPMTNRPRDLHNVLDMLSPGRYGYFFAGERQGVFARLFCTPLESPVWMANGSFKPIGEIVLGDMVIGWADSPKKGFRRRLTPARVVAITRSFAPIVKITFASGRTARCTRDHLWLSGSSGRTAFVNAAVAKDSRTIGGTLAHVVDIPTPVASCFDRAAGWLGGMFDGEGSITPNSFRISQSPKSVEVCAELERTLGVLGIQYSRLEQWKRGGRKTGGELVGYNYCILGGRQAAVDFLAMCQPAKRKQLVKTIVNSTLFTTPDRIVSIEPDGDGEVVSMTTTTGNYVVWGFASKNCGAHQETVGNGINQKVIWNFDGNSNLDEPDGKLALTKAETLHERLRYNMLRRVKSEVDAQLPPKTRQIVDVSIPARHMVAPSMRMLQGGTAGAEMRRCLDLAADGKLKPVIDLVRAHLEEGEKIIMFCYRRRFAEAVADAVNGSFVHGGVPQHKRDLRINALRAKKGAGVLCATIDTTSTGIDLSFATGAVVGELTWEPHELAQMEERLYKFGAGEGGGKSFIQYVIARGTGDELILRGVVSKLDQFERAIGPTGDRMKEDLGAKRQEDALAALTKTLLAMNAAEDRPSAPARKKKRSKA